MRKLVKLSAGLASALFFTLLLGWWEISRQINSPLAAEHIGHYFEVVEGSSFYWVSGRLAQQNFIDNAILLRLYGRLTGLGRQIKAGEYAITEGLTVRQLVEKMERGDVVAHRISLIEGQSLQQALARLVAEQKLVGYLPQLSVIAQVFPQANGNPEGLLFPDTYTFHRGESRAAIVNKAHQRLLTVLNQEWNERSEGLPYKDPYEALIMASLVEKETAVASEREIIAGVFVRRLAKNMRLQTDPTIIYGLGDKFDGNLRSRHLKDASNRYNTYRHNGLPPTPIALVGREAIRAALHPADGKALYFVAKGDGSHHFSSSLDEHNRAVRRYQIERRREDYRSVPQAKL